jgi:hypothetical protein
LSQGSPSGHDLHRRLEAWAHLRAKPNSALLLGFAAKDQLTLEAPGKNGVTRGRQNGCRKAISNYEQQRH